MTNQYRGSDVVDADQRLIGTIDDVVSDANGQPVWAVVDLGLMRSSHYLPIGTGYLTEGGHFVVPYDKHTVKAAPKARRDHVLDHDVERALIRHYELAS